jgi:hypothetical protein
MIELARDAIKDSDCILLKFDSSGFILGYNMVCNFYGLEVAFQLK